MSEHAILSNVCSIECTLNIILISILTIKVIMILSTLTLTFVKESLMSPDITANQSSVIMSGIIATNQDSEELKMYAYQTNQGNKGEILQSDCKCIYFIDSNLNDRYFKIVLLHGFV